MEMDKRLELPNDDEPPPPLSLLGRALVRWRDEGLIHELVPVDNRIAADVVKDTGLWEGVFNKLFFFNVTRYDAIIRLDCDVLIRKHLGYWFERYGNAPAAAIQAKDNIEWNSGAMVLRPNATLFGQLVDKLPEVRKLDPENPIAADDGWNSGNGEQGFLSSFFSTDTDPKRRMHTMPTEEAVLVSSLKLPEFSYFWHHRNHLFATVHLTTAKPYRKPTRPDHPVACAVLREWQRSAEGLNESLPDPLPKYLRFVVDDPPGYLRNCPNTTTNATTNTTTNTTTTPIATSKG